MCRHVLVLRACPNPAPPAVHRCSAPRAAILAYTLVMIFDIGGAMFGLAKLGGLVTSDNRVPGAMPTFLAAAVGTAVGAWMGTTPLIIAAESAVGIKEGGKTGIVALVISACFLLGLVFAPLLQAIPAVATGPVLVLVGTMMMGESNHINWSSMPTAVPAFLTIVIQVCGGHGGVWVGCVCVWGGGGQVASLWTS